ncbi:MAG: DUF1559 domain-containing protein [Planctomycetales bacterium]|nr:DUF1559 domain-containing protein [Planctomycetales bacterium]
MSQDLPPKPPVRSDVEAKPMAAVPPSKGSGGLAAVLIAVLAVVAVSAVCVIGILILLLLPAINAARSAAQRNGSTNNVRNIALALMNYESTHGKFPPQYTVDADGNPLHSWRTLLLPFLEELSLYNQIDLDQPWDSGGNLGLATRQLPTFQSPRFRDPPETTNYVAIAGEGMFFDGPKERTLRDIGDGISNTIVIVEIQDSDIGWAEPRDLTWDEMQWADAGGGPNSLPSAAVVGFADIHSRVITSDIDPQIFAAMLTINGGEAVQPW